MSQLQGRARAEAIRDIFARHAAHDAAMGEVRAQGLAEGSERVRKLFAQWGLGSPSSNLGTARQNVVAPVKSEGVLAADRSFVDLQAERVERIERAGRRVVEAIAFLPDIHAGYHDNDAISCAINVVNLAMRDVTVERRHLVQLGDLLDNDAISSHPRRKVAMLTFDEEIEHGRAIRRRLDTEIEVAKKSICLGNHDDWIERYKVQRAPAFASLIHVANVLELDSNDWDWCHYRHHFKVGRTAVSHEFGRSGANAAQAGLNGPNGKVFGHTHRMAVHYAGMTAGVFRVSATLGCLFRYEHADYGPDAQFDEQWCQGIGIGFLDDRGLLWLNGVPILEGTAIYNGAMVTC